MLHLVEHRSSRLLRLCLTTVLAASHKTVDMPTKVKAVPKRSRRRTFIREWREARHLSIDKLVARVREHLESFSKSTLSRIETGKQDYTQPMLEAIAEALGCEPADLIMRNPNSTRWSIIDSLKQVPETDIPRVAQIVETFKKTGTS